ncbi:sporulation protein [Streptomyces sp. NPDC023327]|uniref:sporulation protein n=1 Tax=Streptomyces sp. NPDC023327 TaxID=3157088 RepID=UPI0033C2610D
MGFRRLFAWGSRDGDQEPPEIDTQITTVAVTPGRSVEGEVFLKGGGHGLKIDHLNLDVVAKGYYYDGTVTDDEVTSLTTGRYEMTVAPGTAERVPFSGTLPWECPVTELRGQALGVDVSLTTRLAWESESPVRDVDFLHISAPPVYEAVLDAFGEAGYLVDGSQLLDEYIPDVEARRGLHQVFFLSAPAPSAGRFGELEVVFLQNVVGALVYVRRAARSTFEWSRKPPSRTFAVAHHEVGEADLTARVRKALDQLTLLDG